VQTCALPICRQAERQRGGHGAGPRGGARGREHAVRVAAPPPPGCEGTQELSGTVCYSPFWPTPRPEKRGPMTNDVSVAVGEAMRLVRRGLSLGMVLALVFGLAAYLWSQGQDPVYEAESTVLVSCQTAPVRSLGVAPLMAPAIAAGAYAGARRADAVAQAALAALGEPDRPTAASRNEYRVSARDDGTSALLAVTGRAGSPERAA